MKIVKRNFKKGLAACIIILGGSILTSQAQEADMQFFRPYDKDGINVFETGKQDTVPFDGLDVKLGAHFTQQFQALDHTNSADANIQDGEDVNELLNIGPGFNLATANLNIDAQLADGIRVNVITYLSSRHHPEAWVKGGYLQFDKLEMLNSDVIDDLMENITIKAGHFEVNYGDFHYRRSDNGNAMYNPLVGNYILDAFNTEIGGELYYQNSGFLAMAAATGGELSGGVTNPDDRSPSIYGKLGYDWEKSDDLRLRLTGSYYTTSKSSANHLYSGDRAGARYYDVMVHGSGDNFRSGRITPGFGDKVSALMINPFIKVGGLELLGTYEMASGQGNGEDDSRDFNQMAVDLVYRFLEDEQLYVAGRYNTVTGTLTGMDDEISADRIQAGLGWFMTDNILLKGEYVTQNYNGYPSANILHEGNFEGFMVEGVVGF